jgi:hypothetical protein
MKARWQVVRKCLWWIGQIIPPLLILPLAAMPPDLPTAFLWIIGWIACAVSFISLACKIDRSRRLGFSALKPSVRPVLTIIFMLFAYVSIQMSLARANEFGRHAAQEINRRCHVERLCPASISGWSPRSDASASETYAGALAKYRVRYRVSGDRKQFSVFVRHDIDRGLGISGGVDMELQEWSKGP